MKYGNTAVVQMLGHSSYASCRKQSYGPHRGVRGVARPSARPAHPEGESRSLGHGVGREPRNTLEGCTAAQSSAPSAHARQELERAPAMEPTSTMCPRRLRARGECVAAGQRATHRSTMLGRKACEVHTCANAFVSMDRLTCFSSVSSTRWPNATPALLTRMSTGLPASSSTARLARSGRTTHGAGMANLPCFAAVITDSLSPTSTV
jgi:hypothetical protein